MSKRILAHLGLFLTNLFFAINLSTIKYITNYHLAAPFGLNIIRVGVGALLFWVIALFNKNKIHILKKDVPRLFLCAVLALFLNQMLFIKGLFYTFSIHVALLFLLTPLLITLISTFLLKELISLSKVIGLLFGISGAIILVTSGKNTGLGINVLLGDSLIILSALAYTFYFILVKPLMNKYPPILIMRWIFTIGFLLCLPFCLYEFFQIDFNSFSSFDYLILFLIVIPGTFLAYIFNLYGIKILNASIAGTYIYLQPLFAVIIAMVFLKEPLEFHKVIAGVLIFSGVYLSNRKKKNTVQ